MKSQLKILGITALMSGLCVSEAWASFGLNHGLGVSVSAEAGSSSAPTGYQSFYNPARLPGSDRGKFNFDLSHGRMDFKTEGEVLVDSPAYRTREGSRRLGPAELEEEPESQWSAGMALPFGGPRWGLGLTASGPFGSLRRFRSRTPYDFQSLRYGTTSPQFRATVGAGWEAIPKWLSVGASALFYISAVGDADAALVSENPTGRLYLDVGLQSALIAGVSLDRPRFRSGLVFRQAQRPHIQVDVSGRMEIGGLRSFDFPLSLQSTLYFEPESWEWTAAYQLHPRLWLQGGLTLSRWSRFQPSYTVLGVRGGDEVQRTLEPGLSLRDTWDPQGSLRWQFHPHFGLSAGYRYRHSPLRSADMAGMANLLDAHTHVMGLGIETAFRAGSFFSEPLRLGIFGQVHRLVPTSVSKTDAATIGAPGYRYSGWGYYFGTGIQTAL